MLHRLSVLLSLSLLGSVGAAETPFLLGGIQVNEPDHERWTTGLRAAGMNAVETTVYAFQGDWDSDHLWWNEEEPAVISEIRHAKAAGLQVVLVLRLALDHAYSRNEFLWHGQVIPTTDAALDSWFRQYTQFVVKWSVIAQREGVDLLALGSEMKELTATVPLARWDEIKGYQGFRYYQRFLRKRARRFSTELTARHFWSRGHPNYTTLESFLEARFEANVAWLRQAHLRQGRSTLERLNARRRRLLDHWERLIATTRGAYHGRLTYAANFDHYRQVGFWNKLDCIGINSYFSLRPHLDDEPGSDALRGRFTTAWRTIFREIDTFRSAQGLEDTPLLFTEIGYTFRRYSTVEPWNHEGFAVIGWKTHRRRLVTWGEQPIDYAERDLALQALYTVHREDPSRLGGLLYWKLSTDRGHESIEPFVLHIGSDSVDPAARSLRAFTE